jgi:hypothetical protein
MLGLNWRHKKNTQHLIDILDISTRGGTSRQEQTRRPVKYLGRIKCGGRSLGKSLDSQDSPQMLSRPVPTLVDLAQRQKVNAVGKRHIQFGTWKMRLILLERER